MDAFTKIAPAMPVVSALVVLALGFALTYNSAARMFDGFQFTRPMAMERASIIYLADGLNGRKQLFLADSDAQNSKQLTDAPLGVVDYALSPDQNQIIYFAQTEDFFNDIWLFNFDDSSNRKLFSCENAMCRQPAWSPDGNYLLCDFFLLNSVSFQTGLQRIDVNTSETTDLGLGSCPIWLWRELP